MNQYHPKGFGFIPEVTKHLLIINSLVFLLVTLVPISTPWGNFYELLGLHLWMAPGFKIWQPLTHMFMHGDWKHLLFNMIGLWILGAYLEQYWGRKKFLTFYLLTGIMAGVIYSGIVYVQTIPTTRLMSEFNETPTVDNLSNFITEHKFRVSPDSDFDFYRTYEQFKLDYRNFAENPNSRESQLACLKFVQKYEATFYNSFRMVGASGAIYGMVLAMAILFPALTIYLYLLIPVKMKYLAMGLAAFALISALNPSEGDNVAHWAHLSGMVVGFVILMYWKRR